MSTTFGRTLLQAEGRYLDDKELQGLEHYLQTFALRNQAYQLLTSHANELVVQALRQLAVTHRTAVETHSSKCKRDMSYSLKCIARAVLLDEQDFFQQDFVLWMDNITHALHKEDSAAQAYRNLRSEIQKILPTPCVALVIPYVDQLVEAFSRA